MPFSKEQDTEVAECHRELEKLIVKIQTTCLENSVEEYQDKKSSERGAKAKKSQIRQQFDVVNEEADRYCTCIMLVNSWTLITVS